MRTRGLQDPFAIWTASRLGTIFEWCLTRFALRKRTIPPSRLKPILLYHVVYEDSPNHIYRTRICRHARFVWLLASRSRLPFNANPNANKRTPATFSPNTLMKPYKERPADKENLLSPSFLLVVSFRRLAAVPTNKKQTITYYHHTTASNISSISAGIFSFTTTKLSRFLSIEFLFPLLIIIIITTLRQHHGESIFLFSIIGASSFCGEAQAQHDGDLLHYARCIFL